MGAPLYTVTAHYPGGGERTFRDVTSREALQRMRAAKLYSERATFTVEGPHRRAPAPARLATVWI